ncbi:lysosomal proton-coupled steroid conjugate and bile acid symporter SLC46A3 isoform X6 [Lepidochelys kempii]
MPAGGRSQGEAGPGRVARGMSNRCAPWDRLREPAPNERVPALTRPCLGAAWRSSWPGGTGPCRGLGRSSAGASRRGIRGRERRALQRRELKGNPDMRKVLLVEPVIIIYAFASFLTAPLIQQYIYQRLWEEASNSSLIENNNTTYCERNKSNPTYIKQK